MSKINTYLQLNLISFFISLFLAYFLFESGIIYPDYYACSTMRIQTFDFLQNTFQVNYPMSCDQNEYFIGFKDFKFIIFNDHSYQQRPLYIFIVYLLNLFLSPLYSLFNITEIFRLLFTVLIVHLSILNLSLLLILEISNVKFISFYDKILIVILNLIHPMAKWGIFGPSIQMFTLFQLVFPIYLVTKDIKMNKRLAILFGLLFFYNRVTLISFLIYYILLAFKSKRFEVPQIIHIILFFIPQIFYRMFFLLRGLNTYDTNTDIYQQFTWIIDFFTGGNRKYGEYFCHRIPGFIKCYIDGSIDLIKYLSVPIIFLILCALYMNKFEKNLFHLSSISFISLYLFWSLIGWYPLRFIYYSFGNFLNLLIIYGFFKLNMNNLHKFFYCLPISIYFLFLTMWNNTEPSYYIEIKYIYASLLATAWYFIANKKALLKIFN